MALTKTGHPCRGYGQIDPTHPSKGVLCRAHSAFYDDPNTLFNIIQRYTTVDQTMAQKRWFVAALNCRPAQDVFYYTGMTALAESTIKGWLDTESPLGDRRAQYLYDTFLKSGHFGPNDVRSMWRAGVKRQLRILQFCVMESRIPPTYSRLIQELLVPYFKGASAEYTVSYLLMVMALPNFQRETMSADMSNLFWMDILDFACKAVDMREFISFDMDDYLGTYLRLHSKLQPDSPLVYPPIYANVRQLLKEHITAAKRRIATSLAPLKEELMAARWSPARVAAALELGIEPEEM